MSRSSDLQVLAALNASGVDYLLVGALALGHYAPETAYKPLLQRRRKTR